MTKFLDAFENSLRIDASRPPESLMRIRAVYTVGATLVVSQIINIGILQATYGAWTYDQTILSIVCAIVAVLIAGVRYYKKTEFYAAAYSALVLAGTFASAVPDRGGVNTAMMAFLPLGPVMCGFMAGRRAAIGFYIAAVALLCVLYWVSISGPPLMASGTYIRETNRFVQGLFALSVSTVISVFISERFYHLVAELRETAEKARNAEAAKMQFLATMSHELRTPLNGVIGLTEALIHADLGDNERRLAETIGKSSESLMRILNDLLDISKIDAGKLAIEMRPASPRDLVRHAVDAWREIAQRKEIKLVEGVESGVPDKIMMDDLRLTQILQNLLSNAIKFTEQGVVFVKLSSRTLEDGRFRLEFRVRDSGKGVPDHLIERIFDCYDQGGAGRARSHGGTGLGLSICRKLAKLMGGTIGVEQTGPDGTTFLLSITADAVKEETPAPEHPDEATFENLKVLVADDNPVNRMVLREYLKTFDISAAFAEDGGRCVEMAAAEKFDLVLMDKEMPVHDGIEATRLIRQGGPSAGAIIIAVTGADDDYSLYADAGFDDRIMKPVTPGALEAALKRVRAMSDAA